MAKLFVLLLFAVLIIQVVCERFRVSELQKQFQQIVNTLKANNPMMALDLDLLTNVANGIFESFSDPNAEVELSDDNNLEAFWQSFINASSPLGGMLRVRKAILKLFSVILSIAQQTTDPSLINFDQ